jgi:hypothetical protein
MSLGLGLALAISGGGPSAAGSPSPLTILSDVALWVRSDLGLTTGATLLWADQSGKSNNLVQATALNQPTITSSDTAFNHHPSLTFDGSTSFLNLASFTPGSGPDFWLWMVAEFSSAGTFPILWSEGSVAHEFRGNASSGEPQLNCAAGAATWGSSVVGSAKAMSCYDKAAGTVGVNVSNGSAVETSVSVHTVTIASPLWVGCRSGLSLFFPGKIAEIVVTTTMPSSSALTKMQTYATTTAQGTGYGSV